MGSRSRVAIPTADDVLLAIEVSHSSLARDRLVKAPLYARAGVPELWLVRVEERAIEVLREPSESGYRRSRVVRLGGRVSAVAVDGVDLAVGSLFPRS